MPSLAELSVELQRQIVEQVAPPGWPVEPLLNVSLVSHRFHELAQPLIFRSLTIPLDTHVPRYCKALLEFLQSPEAGSILASIEHIDLAANAPRDMRYSFSNLAMVITQHSEIFVDLLPRMENLKSIRQRHLSALHLGPQNEWHFILPDRLTDLMLLPLKQVIIESSHYTGLMLLNQHVDLGILRSLSLSGVKTIVSALGSLKGRVPNLGALHIDLEPGHSFELGHDDNRILSEHAFLQIRDFFSMSGLKNIALNSFTQAVPLQDLVASSGPTLRQLVIHTKFSHWRNVQRYCPETVGDTSVATHLRLRQGIGIGNDELRELAAACPGIGCLGIDISCLNLEKALHGKLDALLDFPYLRHLHLFSPREQNNDKTMTGLDLVKLFEYLNCRKKGARLETLLYFQQYGTDVDMGEQCHLWQMADGKILLSYRFIESITDIREMYQGHRLLWTKRRACESNARFSELEFPA
ncbi:MAG: hypothetical protein Q9209_005955 [Squamulea sp. 1 TL-2023]